MRILAVDDEPELTALLRRGLGADGHQVAEAHDGIAAMALLASEDFELAVVDVMLPGMSGFELCRRLKAHDPTMAVILLTARDAVGDRIRGLDAGADDYMIKPFDIAELSARIRAVRRRDALTAPRALTVGLLTIDLLRHRARAGERELALSRTEFDVLHALAAQAGETVSRSALLAQVWETSEHIDPNVVDQYVSYLRRKLEHSESGAQIVTERGVGFRLVAAAG